MAASFNSLSQVCPQSASKIGRAPTEIWPSNGPEICSHILPSPKKGLFYINIPEVRDKTIAYGPRWVRMLTWMERCFKQRSEPYIFSFLTWSIQAVSAEGGRRSSSNDAENCGLTVRLKCITFCCFCCLISHHITVLDVWWHPAPLLPHPSYICASSWSLLHTNISVV